jgi:glycerol-3-phosphate dehydrogenase
MKRDIGQFTDCPFDLLVIGGGIAGAFTAWDATLRGLSVALVEKGDFGHATSSASSKILHGGIRFLQKLQLHLVRESLQERIIFKRIAPHNVYEKPFIIPTSGHGLRSKEVLIPGMLLYELLGFDIRRPHENAEPIPFFKVLSREEVLEIEPCIPPDGLTGGIRFHELHMHNSERMTLAFISSAEREGARVINYTEALGFLKRENSVTGVTAKDLLSGDEVEIRAKIIANMSGPWSYENLKLLDRSTPAFTSFDLSKGVHIVTRSITSGNAIAMATSHKSESLVTRGGRHLFIIPWRGRSLIGTTNVPHNGRPGDLKVTGEDISDFIAEINRNCPAASLKPDDVLFFFGGLYPLVDKEIDSEVYQGGGKSRLFDHEQEDGTKGLISGIAAKYTTARKLAVKVVDLALRKLNLPPRQTTTQSRPVLGGDMVSFQEYLAENLEKPSCALGADVIEELIRNHGTQFKEVIRSVEKNPDLGDRLSTVASTIEAEVLYAVKEEMAMKLEDIVFRRTGLGTIGYPGDKAIERAAHIMSEELGWDKKRMDEEVNRTKNRYSPAD